VYPFRQRIARVLLVELGEHRNGVIGPQRQLTLDLTQ
jgi:hypothetical protein